MTNCFAGSRIPFCQKFDFGGSRNVLAGFGGMQPFDQSAASGSLGSKETFAAFPNGSEANLTTQGQLRGTFPTLNFLPSLMQHAFAIVVGFSLCRCLSRGSGRCSQTFEV